DEEVARTLRTALFPRCLQNDVPAARAAQVSDTTVERIQAAVAKIELGAAAAQANGSSVLVVRPAGPPPTREEVVRALFVLEMNSFPSGLLGFLSLANHSCSPNCKVVEDFEAVGKGVTSEDAARDEDSRREEDDSGNNTHNESDESDIESGVDEVELDDQDDDDDGFDDDKNSCVDYRPIYRLVALRDLRPGEDVTISYLDLDHELLTAEDRRCRLAEHYQFECACGLCEPPRREDYICVVPATAAAAAAAGGPIGAVASVAGTPAGNTKAAVGVCGGRVSALSGECRRCGARLTARELDRLDDRVRATKRRAAVAVERVDAAAEALRRAVAAEARQRRRRRRRRAVGEDGGVVEESTKAGNGVALTAPTTEAVATELESSKPPDLVELRRRVRFGNNSTGRGSVAAATAELRGRIRELSAERARATQLLYAGDGDGTGSSGRAEYAPNDDGDNDQGGGRHVLFRPMDFVLGDGREALSEMEQRQLRKGRGAEAGVKAGSDGGVKGRGGASAGDGGGGRGGRRRRRRRQGPATFLSESGSSHRRFSRQLLVADLGGLPAHHALRAARVLIVGAGGLGSPAALYLAAAGVGRLGIVDHDVVEPSNLQRQVIHGEADVGRSKAESACAAVARLSSFTECVAHDVVLHSGNAIDIISNYDVVLDATDNAATRYLLSDACVLAHKPLVSGSALRMEGQLTVYHHAGGPCYRCVFPTPPPPETVTNCSEGGVLGAVTGVIGCMQALEAIKLICGLEVSYSGKLLLLDAVTGSFRAVRLRGRQATCAACGDAPTIRPGALADFDYVQFCGAAATDKDPPPLDILGPDERVACEEYAQVQASGAPHVLLDVRDTNQFAVAALGGAVNVPWRELPRRLGEVLDLASAGEEDDPLPVYVVCRQGNDSQLAVRLLRAGGLATARDVRGGLRAWSDRVDGEFPRL
ncbi:Molybdenum cofactor synthesis protein 3, partial [Cladochytrium tenue]